MATKTKKQPWEMTRNQLSNKFAQHTDLRSRTLEEALALAETIKKEGWQNVGPSAVNTTALTSGPPTNVIDTRYGTRAGKVTYIIPDEYSGVRNLGMMIPFMAIVGLIVFSLNWLWTSIKGYRAKT